MVHLSELHVMINELQFLKCETQQTTAVQSIIILIQDLRETQEGKDRIDMR